MKTYVISLERVTQRYNYIKNHCDALKMDYQFIDAVDGKLLTEEDKRKYCDDIIYKYTSWLNNGAIGCALSHFKAYEAFLKTNDEFAFIL